MKRLQRAFGMNLHLLRPNIAKVYSDITGRPVGKVIEHGDGRVDAVARPETVTARADDVERITGLPLNDFRRLLYEHHRHAGMTHEQAIARLFPDGKVKA